MVYYIETKGNTMSNTIELVVQELQNRIGQITSQYETQMAVLKAQATEALQAKDQEIASLKSGKENTEDASK
jgi:acetolactate synthase small subunit